MRKRSKCSLKDLVILGGVICYNLGCMYHLAALKADTETEEDKKAYVDKSHCILCLLIRRYECLLHSP